MTLDGLGRRIDYLRVSLTDRCNLRCVYCVPRSGVAWKPREEILTYEEIERFVGLAASVGISKVRLTGGEPLVRKGLAGHVRRLCGIAGLDAVALTTNGLLLAGMAAELAMAGLRRVNISLDTLDAQAYSEITRGGRLSDVLSGIEAALQVGMAPIKINVVVMGEPQQQLLEFARLTLDRPLHVRFIEYMPIGHAPDNCDTGTAASPGTLRLPTSRETLASLKAQTWAAGLGTLTPLQGVEVPEGWGPARYFQLPSAMGSIGVISPRSNHFCGTCNRLRLTADGRLRTCLWSDREVDLRVALRSQDDASVVELIRSALATKPERHHMGAGTLRHMSQIGG